MERLKASFSGVPVDDTSKLVGETAARVYGFDLDALQPIAERIGSAPTDLGQDASLRTDPAEVAGARWWKKEYGING